MCLCVPWHWDAQEMSFYIFLLMQGEYTFLKIWNVRRKLRFANKEPFQTGMAFDFFSVPEEITGLSKSYFQDVQLCVTTDEYTTGWQQLEIGIMAGCTILPLAFIMTKEVIIRASLWVVGGQKLKPGLRLPPIRAFMDDMTILTTTCRRTSSGPGWK